MSQQPLFVSKAEQRRYKTRGLKDAKAAIAAISSPEDTRNNQELLDDLLCGLRFFAHAKRISFHEALFRSEHHHMVETGAVAENYLETGEVSENYRSINWTAEMAASVSRLTTRRN